MNSSQLIIELTLIATTFIVTVFLLTRSYRNTDAVSTKIQKTLTGLLGAFLIMAGTVKFFEPFTTMFTSQIFLSELPFPTLSRWAGQLGEITAGALLMGVIFGQTKLSKALIDKLMLLSTLLSTTIMFVAVYVHLLPNVPAEVLPLQSKPPVITLVILALVWINAYLYYSKKRAY